MQVIKRVDSRLRVSRIDGRLIDALALVRFAHGHVAYQRIADVRMAATSGNARAQILTAIGKRRLHGGEHGQANQARDWDEKISHGIF